MLLSYNYQNGNYNENGDTCDNDVLAASTAVPSSPASLLPQPEQPKAFAAQSEGNLVSRDHDEDYYLDPDEDDHDDGEDDHDHDEDEHGHEEDDHVDSSIECSPRIM